MALQPTLSGARGKFGLIDQNGVFRVRGIISQVSWTKSFQAEPTYILGRFSPASVQYTSADLVSVTATGWRNLGHTGATELNFPKLQELLLFQNFMIVVEDRQAQVVGQDPRIVRIHDVLPTSIAQGLSARQLSEMTVSFLATRSEDEGEVNAEDASATFFP